MDDICVVHLARAKNGPEPFRDFVESYRAHPAGVEHALLIIFKGFGEQPDLSEYEPLLEGIPYQTLFLPDEGFDITPYFRAAETFEYNYLCFLNSFSVILEGEWLAKMYGHVRRPDVGVVGATGSWTSHHSWVSYEQGKPSIYASIMSDVKDQIPSRHPVHQFVFGLSEGLEAKIRGMPLPLRLAFELYYYGIVAAYYRVVQSIGFYLEDRRADRERWRPFNLAEYAPFPTPHLRTNAFMIRRDVMLKITRGVILSKKEAHKFESGKESMTNQVLRMGLNVLVVGRDGRAYEKEEWPLSQTMYQGRQQNLLVADNHTRLYTNGDARLRTILSRLAWGREAAPSAPGEGERELVR
jgi:hypothetical protein